MAQKKVILTWVAEKEEDPQFQLIGQTLAKNGLDVSGNPWIDDLPRLAWTQLATFLASNDECDAWVIAAEKQVIDQQTVRYGLSALMAVLKAEREKPISIFLLGVDFLFEAESLPTPFQGCHILTTSDEKWGAQVVAKLFRLPKPVEVPYRLSLRANTAYGQWYEVGPKNEEWQGIMFGASQGATISHHAVGPKGVLPEKTVLEYPTQGIEAEIDGTKFSACSVQNKITPDESYFIKVADNPEQVIFGGHPGTDQQEVFIIKMS